VVRDFAFEELFSRLALLAAELRATTAESRHVIRGANDLLGDSSAARLRGRAEMLAARLALNTGKTRHD
jgi:hypothetical protein